MKVIDHLIIEHAKENEYMVYVDPDIEPMKEVLE
jgi:hypothetical protein